VIELGLLVEMETDTETDIEMIIAPEDVKMTGRNDLAPLVARNLRARGPQVRRLRTGIARMTVNQSRRRRKRRPQSPSPQNR
jgi:hypothetical protein